MLIKWENKLNEKWGIKTHVGLRLDANEGWRLSLEKQDMCHGVSGREEASLRSFGKEKTTMPLMKLKRGKRRKNSHHLHTLAGHEGEQEGRKFLHFFNPPKWFKHVSSRSSRFGTVFPHSSK